MWSAYEEADLFLITTNSFLRKDGCLVMGAGIAKEARERYPGIDERLGRFVKMMCGHKGIYNTLISPNWPRAKLGIFQVKRDYAEPADLVQIGRSLRALKLRMVQYFQETGCSMDVHMNFPGIGCGGLEPDHVRPLLESLPHHVHIWRREEERPDGHEEAVRSEGDLSDHADWLQAEVERLRRLRMLQRRSGAITQ